MPEFRCVRITTEEQLTRAQQIRIQVFVDEQGIPGSMEFDDKDPVSIHVLGYEGDLPIATGRLVPADRGAGQLSRIAVLPEYRGRSYGKEVVRTLEVLARQEHMHHLFLYPHSYLERFYASLGYKTVPGVEDQVAGHPLILMEKDLG